MKAAPRLWLTGGLFQVLIRHSGLMAWSLLLAAWPGTGVFAITEGPPSDAAEATFLIKVTGYIEWPAQAFLQADSPIVVGIVGADGLATALKGLAREHLVQGRRIEVIQLQRPDQVARVHLLYIGAGVWDRRAHWTSGSRDTPALMATNAPGGVDQGAALGMVHADQRLRVEASLPAAERSGVRLSSRLLAIAHRVLKHPP